MRPPTYCKDRYYRANGMAATKQFLLAIPNEVTIRPREELLKVFGTGPCYLTAFKEVDVVPYHEVELSGVREFLRKPIHSLPIRTNVLRTPRQYAERIVAALEDAIASRWDSRKFHLVSFSSGYDTRLIGVALHNLYKRYGDGWLGDIAFFEADGEYERARQVLDLIGWKGFDFIKYNRNVTDAHEYHAPSIEGFNPYERFNGVVGFPMNVWWDPINWIQFNVLAPQDDSKIQCISGFASNEYAKAYNTFKGLRWYYKWIYHHPIACFKEKGQWVYPFYDLNFAEVLTANRQWRYRKCGISKMAIKYLAPETWDIPGMTVAEREPTVRTLSDRLMKIAANQYASSWYGSKVNPLLQPTTNLMDYSEWWGSWSLAAHCEYLISEGHTVKVG